jgi:hypothetical protein
VPELRERDFRAALDFVGEVHDAQDRDEFRAILLPGYRALVPALHVSYNEIEGDGRVAAAIVEPELPAWSVPVWERYAGNSAVGLQCADKPVPPKLGPSDWPQVLGTLTKVSAYNGPFLDWLLWAPCSAWTVPAVHRYTGPGTRSPRTRSW